MSVLAAPPPLTWEPSGASPNAVHAAVHVNAPLQAVFSLQDFICEHYGEDGSGFDREIRELTELRQVLERLRAPAVV